MLRVVVDTNTIISALVFGGNPGKILALANHGYLEIFLSPFILNETKRVLGRKFRWHAQKIEAAIRLLEEISTMVHPTNRVTAIREKESDNRILEAAQEARADFLVTGDTKHLQPHGEWQGTKIVSARGLLQFLG